MNTDQQYLEITFQIQDNHHDLLIDYLLGLDFDGFEQQGDNLLAYIPSTRFNDASRGLITNWIATLEVPCDLLSEKVWEPQNWNETWEKTIEPIQVGNFYVRPTWKPEPEPDGSILLEIDPKMAFGTGYHETTRCMLRMLESTVSGGETVLDVGTGTGILAIAALKLGARSAFGFDIDEWSFVNANENAQLNGVEDSLQVKEGSFESVPEKKYSLVLANVNRNMLLGTASIITAFVQDNGTLLLSGLLESDEADILNQVDYAGLSLENRLQENEWICLKFRKVVNQ
jgi:ribosomal protein L11 methyltransferase